MLLPSTTLVCLIAASVGVAEEAATDPVGQAIELLTKAKDCTEADARQKLTDRAQSTLQRFLEQTADKQKRAVAGWLLADILTAKAESLIERAKLVRDDDRKTTLQKQARRFVTEAQRLYQAAHDHYQHEYRKFPKFIDPSMNKHLYEARHRALIHNLRVRLKLAQSIYKEAQTYDTGTAEAKELLGKAERKFADIHAAHRSVLGGLHARLWQARCFDELGDIRKALGIYNELLDHAARSSALQDQALLFRLKCLNGEKRNDYQLVVIEASDWLEKVSEMQPPADSEVGLGIRWQLACAQLMFSKSPDAEPHDRESSLQAALSNARHVARLPGPYQTAAKAMIARLDKSALSSDQQSP